MLRREHNFADSSILAEIAGQDMHFPASFKTTAKTTTKTV